MIRYYKLFDLLNRRNMNKSDLLEIMSSKTIAKLSKGANINTDTIDRICLFLDCQPNDIMEVVRIVDEYDESTRIISKNSAYNVNDDNISVEERIIEMKPEEMSFNDSDEELLTERQYLGTHINESNL